MTTPTAAVPRARAAAKTMRAAAIDRFGPPTVLTLHTLPVPKVGPNDVLIALHTAGVGVWDAHIRNGMWATGREPFPLVLGTDGAGVVAARGSRVRRFRVDDRVWAYEFGNPKGGFYAEYVAVKAEHVGRVPRHLDLLEAGAAAVTGLTALQGIGHLRLTEGETVLIFGASGAVGTLAIQFAKHRGARVLGTASGDEAASLVRTLGADQAIDARHADGVEQLQAFAPNGIDAVLALAGGDALEHCLRFVRSGGRVAYPNGVEPEPKAPSDVRISAYDAATSPRKFAELERAADEVQLRVPIAATYPLAEAAQAHTRIEEGHVLGRITLQIAEV